MKVISVNNPWGYWISLGIKRIETRRHKRFAGLKGSTIGIHCTKSFNTQALELGGTYVPDEFLKFDEHITDMHYGAIVCTAYVSEFRKLDYYDSYGACIYCGNEDYYGLILDDIKKLNKPYFCGGKQGIWHIDASLLH